MPSPAIQTYGFQARKPSYLAARDGYPLPTDHNSIAGICSWPGIPKVLAAKPTTGGTGTSWHTSVYAAEETQEPADILTPPNTLMQAVMRGGPK